MTYARSGTDPPLAPVLVLEVKSPMARILLHFGPHPRCTDTPMNAVTSPTPQIFSTGIGCRNSTTASGATIASPSGLALLEASLARNLVGATPT